MELTEGDSLEGSAHTPLYNPHILPLISIHPYIIGFPDDDLITFNLFYKDKQFDNSIQY